MRLTEATADDATRPNPTDLGDARRR